MIRWLLVVRMLPTLIIFRTVLVPSRYRKFQNGLRTRIRRQVELVLGGELRRNEATAEEMTLSGEESGAEFRCCQGNENFWLDSVWIAVLDVPSYYMYTENEKLVTSFIRVLCANTITMINPAIVSIISTALYHHHQLNNLIIINNGKFKDLIKDSVKSKF